MDSYQDDSWDDQDFEELQDAILGDDPEEQDTNVSELDCYVCGDGNWDKCDSCGHDAHCEESECQRPIHAVTCSGCHASDNSRAGNTCSSCGHLEFCDESDCEQPTHIFEDSHRRIASSEELCLIRRLGELRNQKRNVEDEIKVVREKLVSSAFSSRLQLFESQGSEKPIAWAKYRESYTISYSNKSKLKSLFPEVFQRFFRKSEVYTIYLESSNGSADQLDSEDL